ncbi:hypothetical protein F3N42_02465 [Marinihelvus fidelis]|uniref:Uncharacterized protein n=1 Tax=Marinihelvus fidelis TaxID=2613842 RepID=A0A5N0TE33_9GAMM|nr:hypothetical protein [Marinihelvus fidelis]KAA9133240.1 hypothetical protein F3N42_02465 [Marinihelvus fidelis]
MTNGKWMSGFALCAVCAAMGAQAESNGITPGHTAAWYDPARDGEGWVLEILEDDRASVYWYTYDESGGQRWLTGTGQVLSDADGDYIDVPELLVTRGAVFGEDFDPDDVVREVAGSATFRFPDCQSGTVAWSAFNESAVTNLTRLTRTMGVDCETINGVPGEPVQVYAGQSGDWFDLAHDGEGFTVQWLSRDQALVFWFSYDGQGNQVWMTGLGHEQDGVIVVPELTTTTGGLFGSAFDPAGVERIAWGQMDMSLACNDGGMNYQSALADFGSGSQDLQRLSNLAGLACPYDRPGLDDLYTFQWTEIPLPEDGSISVRRLTNAGAVIGMRALTGEGQGEVVMLSPGATEWVTLDSQVVWNDGPLLSNESADRVVASEVPDPDQLNPFEPIAWWADSGWENLDGIDDDHSVLSGGDREGNVLVGYAWAGGITQDEYPWIWDPVDGQRALPLLTDVTDPLGYTPVAAATDAAVAVGYRSFPTIGTPPPPIALYSGFNAVHWSDAGARRMRAPDNTPLSIARGCSTDCSVVIGEGFSRLENDDPRLISPMAWFWTPDGRFGVLEPALGIDNVEQEPVAISGDGTQIVGTVTELFIPATPAPASVQAFLWTQRTGIELLAFKNDEVSGNAELWDGFSYDSRSVDVSADGARVLINLYQAGSQDSPPERSGIMTLVPRE